MQKIKVLFTDGTNEVLTVAKYSLENGIFTFIFENGNKREFPQGVVKDLDVLANLQEMNS